MICQIICAPPNARHVGPFVILRVRLLTLQRAGRALKSLSAGPVYSATRSSPCQKNQPASRKERRILLWQILGRWMKIANPFVPPSAWHVAPFVILGVQLLTLQRAGRALKSLSVGPVYSATRSRTCQKNPPSHRLPALAHPFHQCWCRTCRHSVYCMLYSDIVYHVSICRYVTHDNI